MCFNVIFMLWSGFIKLCKKIMQHRRHIMINVIRHTRMCFNVIFVSCPVFIKLFKKKCNIDDISRLMLLDTRACVLMLLRTRACVLMLLNTRARSLMLLETRACVLMLFLCNAMDLLSYSRK